MGLDFCFMKHLWPLVRYTELVMLAQSWKLNCVKRSDKQHRICGGPEEM